MTIINNSLAHYGDTLVYNNECELLWPEDTDPYNPLNLPANTVRVRTNNGNAPIKDSKTSYETATLVSGTTDVYDVYKSGTDFNNLFYWSTNVIEVLGANTTGITNMSTMFQRCTSLTSVALFDTSSVTDMKSMFRGCSSLTSVPLLDTSNITSMMYMFSECSSLTTVPLFNTSSVTDMDQLFYLCSSLTSVPLFDTSNVTSMTDMFNNCTSLTSVPLFNTSNVTSMFRTFYDCINVETGALALYQQASTQTNPPYTYSMAFRNCGSNTTTGAAELAQIPDDWK